MDPRATAIHLEVRLDGDSPVGRAYDERGSAREFAGWMSLVAAIDDLMTTPPQGADSVPPDERPGS